WWAPIAWAWGAAALGANDGPTDALDVWAGQTLTIAPGPTGLRLWLDLHERRTPSAFTAIVRPGVGWQATPWLSLWAGYAWVPTDADDGPTVHEHRAWEQVILQHKVDPVSLQLRLRQEQRVRHGQPGVSHRLRALARSNIAISGPVGVALWDEMFVGFNDPGWLGYVGFDQNRAFVGPYLEGPRGVRWELGYMNQAIPRRDGLQVHHVVAVNLFFSWGPAPKPPPAERGGGTG
ncbi:MAG TPA: DUF2490 domain-containing protein, partial [Myxococcota bacterium]|nr:DUF2490 domain-containing protein [Myxococcota bacterium]